jgi:hypothetical protein
MKTQRKRAGARRDDRRSFNGCAGVAGGRIGSQFDRNRWVCVEFVKEWALGKPTEKLLHRAGGHDEMGFVSDGYRCDPGWHPSVKLDRFELDSSTPLIALPGREITAAFNGGLKTNLRRITCGGVGADQRAMPRAHRRV